MLSKKLNQEHSISNQIHATIKHKPHRESSYSRTALLAGVFDPPTIGHLDLIQRSHLVCDQLIVAIANNPDKTPLFSTEQRLQMLHEISKPFAHVQIDAFEGLTLDYAKAKKVRFLLRGIRNCNDLEYESQMARIHTEKGNLETIFLIGRHPHVKSNLIHEILHRGSSIQHLVPASIEAFIKKYLD